MSYEDQLIREATEGPSFQEVHEDYLEQEPVEPNDSNETGDQQCETREERMRHFSEGRDYWWQYTKINGYAFKPSQQGLKRLSRNLDVNIPHLRKRINDFLSA